MKMFDAKVLMITVISCVSSVMISDIHARSHHQMTQETQQQIVNGVMGIVNGGINIAVHDGDPESQFNAGLGIASSLGSLIFHLARSIDPEDLRSMSEDEITQELSVLHVGYEVQKRMPHYRMVRS